MIGGATALVKPGFHAIGRNQSPPLLLERDAARPRVGYAQVMNQEMELRNIRWASRWPANALSAVLAFCAAAVLLGQGETVKGDYFPVTLPVGGASAVFNPPSLQSWASAPRGAQSFNGVPFKIDGRLAVTGIDDARNGEFHPTRVNNIPVGRKAARLHVLHGAEGIEKDGVPFAKLILHYVNGQQRAMRLAYGVHARSWEAGRKEPKTGLLDPDSRLAWTGNGDDAERGSVALRLFQTAISNPLPEQEISHVEFVSLFSRATPFIAGLTTETGDAAVAQPVSTRRVVKKSLELEDSVYRDEFVIHATDGGTGRALTNAFAALTISDDEASFYFGEARADGDGVIRLPFPPQQTVAFSALVRAPGRMPFIFSGTKTNGGGFPREIEAKLARGVKIGGVVTDVKGRAVPGAEVVVYKTSQTGPREYTRLDHDTIRTAEDGQWSSESVPAEFEGFSFQVAHPEFRSLVFTQAVTTSAAMLAISREDLLAGKAVMALPAALRVEGVVADESGKPVKDADLRLFDSGRAENPHVFKADAEGKFSFVVPRPGDIGLMIQAKGFKTKQQSVEVEAGLKPVTITMAKAEPLRGRVMDQNREPVAGARVKLDSWNGERVLQWQTLTDRDGGFTWDSPPEGTVMFYVSATNYSSMRTSVSTSSREHTFNLRRMSRVFGRVVDAETKKPVDQFVVITGRSYNSDEPIRWERYDTQAGRKGEYSARLTEYSSQGGRSQIMVEAPGYLPAASPVFTKAGVYTNDFELKRGRGIAGIVQLADGTAVSNATVVLVERSDSAYMEKPGEFARSSSGGAYQRSNARGQFEFPAKLEPHTVFAAHELGYAEVRASNVLATGKVVLQSWGRIKGLLRVGKKVEPGQSVMLQSGNWRYGFEGRFSAPLSLNLKVDPEADGSFVIDKVPPGERKTSLHFKLNERENSRTAYSHGTPVTVKAGETSEVTIGGGGRTVVGRMTILGGTPEDVDWRRDQHTMQSQVQLPAHISPPVVTGNMTDEERRKVHQEYNERATAFWRTDEGRALEHRQRNYILRFETNGTFRVDNVEPGKYQIYVSLTNPDRPDNYYEHIGSMNKDVTIPPAPSDKPDEPFDLGLSEVSVRNIQRTGRPAPKFEVKTFDGKTVKLEDFAGKFVLLDLWATWSSPRNLDLQMLKAVHTAYGKDERLVMLGLNFDSSRSAAEKAIEQEGIKWPQGYIGEWAQTRLPAMFGLQDLPANILIDPTGKIAASNLRGSNIRTTVRNRLGNPRGAGATP